MEQEQGAAIPPIQEMSPQHVVGGIFSRGENFRYIRSMEIYTH
jgi:hypothetical protein